MNEPKHVGCSVKGCDGEHRALGLCHRHYAQKNRHGVALPDPTPIRKPKKQRARMDPAIKAGTLVQTITLEEWLRRRDEEQAGDVHFVRPQALGGHGGVE